VHRVKIAGRKTPDTLGRSLSQLGFGMDRSGSRTSWWSISPQTVQRYPCPPQDQALAATPGGSRKVASRLAAFIRTGEGSLHPLLHRDLGTTGGVVPGRKTSCRPRTRLSRTWPAQPGDRPGGGMSTRRKGGG